MAQTINLTLDAGVDFFARLATTDANGAPSDLTGYTSKAQIRPSAGGSLSGSFVVTPNGIVGTIDLFMDSVQTTLLLAGTYVYDVIIQNATTGDSQRVVQGTLTVTAGVTV